MPKERMIVPIDLCGQHNYCRVDFLNVIMTLKSNVFWIFLDALSLTEAGILCQKKAEL